MNKRNKIGYREVYADVPPSASPECKQALLSIVQYIVESKRKKVQNY